MVIVHYTCTHVGKKIKMAGIESRVLARIFANGGALCIINNLGVWSIMCVVNYMCVSCNLQYREAKQTKVSQRSADFIWLTSII